MAQSLYRRYRPQRFSEVLGQDHAVRALRNAVASGTVGHAYLFSGPRGTGKTSTARILAKALNCDSVVDGEPCGECEPCRAVEAGASFDLHELDAASNRGINEIKDLISRVGIGAAGKRKVYILDEVHQLTKDAAAVLLKTLEEPPEHVVWVLATTDPHKVLPTIRSRTQHFEFGLLPATTLRDHVAHVAKDAGLDVTDDVLDHAVKEGKGSARDTLSALDRLVAAGGVPERSGDVAALIEALADGDTAAALAAVAGAVASGVEPRVLAEEALADVRDAFLLLMSPGVVDLADADRARLTSVGERLRPRGATRAMEVLGDTLADLRNAPDPRVPVDVAVVRLTRADADHSLDALAERVAALEAGAAGGAPAAPARSPSRTSPKAASPGTKATVPSPPPPPPSPPRRSSAKEKAAPSGAPPASGDGGAGADPVARSDNGPPVAQSGAALPSREELTLAWGDAVLPGLAQKAKARFSGGRFMAVGATGAQFGLPNEMHRKRCEDVKELVESALAAHFGRPVPLELVVDDGRAAAPVEAVSRAAPASTTPGAGDDEVVDVSELTDAPGGIASGVELLEGAFPGAEVVDDDE